MTGRRKKERRPPLPASAPRASAPAPPSPRQRPRWIPSLLVVGVAAALWLSTRGADAPPPAVPADLTGLDPEVRALVEEHVRRVRADPSAQNHGTLGLVYEAQGMWREARQSFAAACALDGDPLYGLHQGIASASLGDGQAALALFRNAVDELPGSAAAHYRLGDALLEAGALDEALQQMEAAVRLAPDRAESHIGLGAVLHRKQAYAEARTHLARAVELDPAQRSAHYQLGATLRELGLEEEAAREMALGMDAEEQPLPDPLDERMRSFRLGYTSRLDGAVKLLRSGRTDDAIAVLEALWKQRPDDVNTLNNLAIACLRKGDSSRCRELLARARELDERAFATWINLAALEVQAGTLERAQACADRAVELAAQVGRAHQMRGEVLARRGHWQEAHDALKLAASLDARDPEVHLALARTCLALARHDEARAALLTVTSLDPTSLAAHVDLCQLHATMGDFEAARQSLGRVRELAPGDPALESMALEIERHATAKR